MTHKPNILALKFTHQNKDEKNFADTAALLGVLTGQKLAIGFVSLCGTLFLELGVAEGPRAGGGDSSLGTDGKNGKVLGSHCLRQCCLLIPWREKWVFQKQPDLPAPRAQIFRWR